MVEPVGFEGLSVGQRFNLPSRTVTEAHFAAFQAISGDNHPIHYDRAYCQAQGHDDIVAHGLQVLCYSAAGAGLFPHLLGKTLIGFIEQSCKFLAPVYPGDTLYPALVVSELVRQRTTGVIVVAATIENERGIQVIEGQQKYLARLAGP